ncbi:MAG: hypothetical protein F9K17_04945 [Phycisphaerae bacterium]|nr:MAG: hypothetical protein F9K17_04945 [Phycisphaerae bacterium]
MMFRSSKLWIMILVAATGFSASPTVVAQSDAASKDKAAPASGDDMLGLEKILDAITKNLTVRYNLSEDQAVFTRDLLGTRVRKFLQEHQREAWPILRELMHYQMNGETPDAAAAKRIAEAAVPLFEKAKQAIIDGNNAWRGILTDEQKVKHDYDYKMMVESQFPFVDGRFKEWKEGKAESGSLFPPAPQAKDPNEPPKPPRPSPSTSPLQQDAANKDRFTAFTDEFIKVCQLDEGQTTAARSVLTEILAKFEAYTNQQKAERQKLAAEIRKALIEGDAVKQKALEEQERALIEPIEQLYEDLVSRLEAQLRAEQRPAYEATLGKNRPTPQTAKPGDASAAKPAPAAKPAQPEASSGGAAPEKPEGEAKSGGGKRKKKD